MEILEKMSQLKTARYFLEPVDPILLQAPDYFTIITAPMDYSSIKRMLIRGKYVHWSQVLEHLMLVSDNAVKYNPPGHLVHTYAKKTIFKLSQLVMSQLTKLLASVHAASIPPTELTPSDPPLGPGPAKPLAPVPPFSKERANKILQRIYDISKDNEKPPSSPEAPMGLPPKKQKREEGLPRSFSARPSGLSLDDDDDDDDDLFIQKIKSRPPSSMMEKGGRGAGALLQKRANNIEMAEMYAAKRHVNPRPVQEHQRYQAPPPPHLLQRSHMPLSQHRQELPKTAREPIMQPRQPAPAPAAPLPSSLQFESLKDFVARADEVKAAAAAATGAVTAASTAAAATVNVKAPPPLPARPMSPANSMKLSMTSIAMPDTSMIKLRASYEARIAGYESKISGLDKVIAEKSSKLAERDSEFETLISINLELAAEVAQLRQHILNLEQQMTAKGLVPQQLGSQAPQAQAANYLPPEEAEAPVPVPHAHIQDIALEASNAPVEPSVRVDVKPQGDIEMVEREVSQSVKYQEDEDEDLPDWVLRSA